MLARFLTDTDDGKKIEGTLFFPGFLHSELNECYLVASPSFTVIITFNHAVLHYHHLHLYHHCRHHEHLHHQFPPPPLSAAIC